MGINIRIVQNFNYENDYDYAFKYNRWLFYFLAIWPFKNYRDTKIKILRKVIEIFMLILFMIFIIPVAFGVFHYSENFIQLLKGIFIFVITVGLLVKYVILAEQNHFIYTCIEQLDLDWLFIVEKSRGTMLKYAEKSRKMIVIVVLIVVVSSSLWQLVSLFRPPVVIDNVAYHELPTMSDYVFFDARVEPYYYYACLIQYSGQYALMFSIVSSCQPITFALHTCGQYKIIATMINDLKIGHAETIGETKQILILILRKQYLMMRLSSNIEKTYNALFLVEWLVSMFGSCFTTYLFIIEEFTLMVLMRNLLAFVSFTFTFFFLCYYGDQITAKYLDCGVAVYMSQWYELPKRDTIFPAMMSGIHRFPKQLTAGKLKKLSLKTYAAEVNRSFTVLSLLKNVI